MGAGASTAEAADCGGDDGCGKRRSIFALGPSLARRIGRATHVADDYRQRGGCSDDEDLATGSPSKPVLKPAGADAGRSMQILELTADASPRVLSPLLSWKRYTSSMLHVLSFLELDEVVVMAQVTRTWFRIANRYLRDYCVALPADEMGWILSQIDQNSAFFEKSMITCICTIVAQHTLDGRQVDDLVALPEIIELQERVRHHRGHYATFPALAIQLLNSLGQTDDKSATHEVLFRCRHNQRRRVTASNEFLVAGFRMLVPLFSSIKEELSSARDNLVEVQRQALEEAAERFVHNETSADGRKLTPEGLLPCDIHEQLSSFQRQVADAAVPLKSTIQECVKSMFEGYRDGLDLPELTKEKRLLEETEDEAARNEFLVCFVRHSGFFIKSLADASIDSLVSNLSSALALQEGIVAKVKAHIETTNRDRMITGSFHEVLGILPPINNVSDSTVSTLLTSHTAFYSQRYGALSDVLALLQVQAELDRYLDVFLDGKAAVPPLPPADENSESSPHDGSGGPPQAEHANDAIAIEERDSGESKSDRATSIPGTRAQVAAKVPGWLSDHLLLVYEDAARAHAEESGWEDPSQDTLRIWRQNVRDFAIRHYVFHVISKENANHVLNYAPRGLVVAPQSKRYEHVKKLSAALQCALKRDLGDITQGCLLDSEKTFRSLACDIEFVQALIGMSIKWLAEAIESKRRDVSEFEARRRKSDLD